MSLPAIDIQGSLSVPLLASSQTLGAGASLVSDIVDCSTMVRVMGTVAASHDGTLVIEQANDQTGSSFPHQASFAVAAGVPRQIRVSLVLPFVRARYTNGGTIQLSFLVDLWLMAA